MKIYFIIVYNIKLKIFILKIVYQYYLNFIKLIVKNIMLSKIS